ncbi:MAG: family 16 glycosylhydrolase, partial [Gemmatimonadetes bacterium]|nr:family 16 glycosylhydrolase [Gemmatimonadota bacterium]
SDDRIIWIVDGERYLAIDDRDVPTPADWVFNKSPFFIILNLAVGGNWPGPPDETTVFPQTMLVDYVRVYQGNQ